MILLNAKTLPKRYYGLHMVEGVCQYTHKEVNDGQPYRVLILENALKQMDTTFEGRPVYVIHRPEVDLANIQQEADGYVVKSFFNKADGKHWCEFMVVSDAGHEAIAKGWKLSNAYQPKQLTSGGKWHEVDYVKEITEGEYDHLALVPDPRYEESIILTPEAFKAYNSGKEQELLKLANSKETPSMLNIFRKAKVEKLENSALKDLETLVVTLKSGTEKPLPQLINEAEMAEEKAKKENDAAAAGDMPMANGEHHVQVGEEKMSVNALLEKYNALMEKNAVPASDEDAKKKAEELAAHEAKEIAEKKANEAKEAEAKAAEEKKNNAKAAADKAAAAQKSVDDAHFETLRNVADKARTEGEKVADLPANQIERGKSRYGSG